MGGVKKKSLASMEKSQDSEQTAQGQEQAKPKDKKGKEKSAPQQQKRLPILPPRMTEAELIKVLTPMKALTAFSASKALGVNAAVAVGVLRDLESKKLVAKVGGYSSHSVWAIVKS
jgi:ribosomal protein S25